jgi:serine/threonine protein kinase
VDLFCGEADLSRMLRHANVIEVLETGSVGETYYMAMEFIDGRDLGQVLSRCRERQIQLPVDFALFLAHCILDALHYAHHARSAGGRELHVVHCDVSPSNVFISRIGEIKLGDFGIAKVRSLDPVKRSGIWGKVHYASPELIRGDDILPQADVWAAAVILYELLTLCRPFVGETVDEIATEILRSDPPPRSPGPLRRRRSPGGGAEAPLRRAGGYAAGDRRGGARAVREGWLKPPPAVGSVSGSRCSGPGVGDGAPRGARPPGARPCAGPGP